LVRDCKRQGRPTTKASRSRDAIRNIRVASKFLFGEIRTNGNPFADFEELCDEGNDVVEDVIGVLWEFPIAFQRIVVWRDHVTSLDSLSGQIYGERAATNPVRIAMRKLMASKEAALKSEADTASGKRPALAAVE